MGKYVMDRGRDRWATFKIMVSAAFSIAFVVALAVVVIMAVKASA